MRMNVCLLCLFLVLQLKSVQCQSNYETELKIGDSCTTPRGLKGRCSLLHGCPSLMETFANPTHDAENYLESYLCTTNRSNSLPGNYIVTVVCCSENELSDAQECGYQHIENGTVLEEFPWLASIIKIDEYKKEEMFCYGSLISNRHVLTTAGCSMASGSKLKVRLGRYKIGKSEYYTELDVEEKLPHPFYNNLNYPLNAIGLLRLNGTVTFSGHVRPICLPLSVAIVAKAGDALHTTFWNPEKMEKKNIVTTFITNNECKATAHLRYNLNKFSMCSMYERPTIRTSCLNTFGAPVMYANGNQWYIEGVVNGISTLRIKRCVIHHTRISPYLSWIRDLLH